jgi:outer membrane protein assembly factor BamA
VWLDTVFAIDVRVRTLTCLLLLLAAAPTRAITGIDQEEDVSDLLVTRPEEYGEEETEGRRWAVIPQVGYGPDTGPLGGLKFTHRNLFGSGVTFDVAGDYSLNQQQSLGFSVGAPDVFGDGRFLAMFSADYGLDPQRDFFGLGNNDVGPDPVSTHEERDIAGELTLGWRPFRGRLAVALSAGIRHIDIEHGDRDDDTPFTTDLFPELPGIEGGFVNPIGLGLVYNGRDDLIWPTRGWRIIAKVSHTNRELGSDFQFTRAVLDVGYLYGFFGGRHVLGARVSGGFIDGPSRDVPFWELTELGGDDTLRGFFPRRFLGQAHALVNLEYRVKLFAFDFFDIWRVQVAAAAFGDAGRVFVHRGDLDEEFDLTNEVIDQLAENIRYSYGGGLRFIVSRAIIARVDVGFSEEETGLVYLKFGHTF